MYIFALVPYVCKHSFVLLCIYLLIMLLLLVFIAVGEQEEQIQMLANRLCKSDAE